MCSLVLFFPLFYFWLRGGLVAFVGSQSEGPKCTLSSIQVELTSAFMICCHRYCEASDIEI